MITNSDPQSITAIVYVLKTEPLTEFIVRMTCQSVWATLTVKTTT